MRCEAEYVCIISCFDCIFGSGFVLGINTVCLMWVSWSVLNPMTPSVCLGGLSVISDGLIA